MNPPDSPSDERPGADTGSNPVTPRSLRPPAEDGVEVDLSNPQEAPFETGSVPLEAEMVADGEGTGERYFIVAEGEQVQGVEKPPATKEKLSAVLAAVLIHVVLVILLGLWYTVTPPPPPPQISVSAVPVNQEAEIENQVMQKTSATTQASAAAATPVISSTAISNFALPEATTTTDLSMVAMSAGDAGFGMSMSGFGDVSNMKAIPASMQSRCSMSQRMKRLRESGGEERAEKAVREGLKFLATKQNADGSFGEEYTSGMTGLALLAYLGHCETPESPKFGDAVVRAAQYLMELALKNDGKMTNGKGGNHESYEHAIATYALCELFTMTKESGKEIPRLESVLRKSVGLVVDSQTKTGGWPYGFKGAGKEDMSVSGWQIQALKAAYNTGKNFAGVDRALDDAMKDYLPRIQDSEGAFKYGPEDARGKPTLTGAAVLALQIWNQRDTAVYKKGIAYLATAYKNPSVSDGGHAFYAPYYNTQAFFLHEGTEWENYNKAFQPKLLDAQNEDGSWLTPNGARKDHQIMNTAWAVLMLEVYYRYLPTTDKVSGLKAR